MVENCSKMMNAYKYVILKQPQLNSARPTLIMCIFDRNLAN